MFFAYLENMTMWASVLQVDVFRESLAHCPKIALNESETLWKVVVKIPMSFLAGGV